ncbi:probable transmembrane protein [hydrothermal vent metagenome]|uniref:Probable transmembrane protein n=1 Tax=hydrothermal vent metagenome TaxID=652676 RepID=A0A1W1CL29_9ZZZZ
MREIGVWGIVSLLLIGCGGRGPKVGVENNTTIPRSGIYNRMDDEQTKYLKVINYARGIARECKSNEVSEESRGFFPAASPLTINHHLYKAAREHSIDLAKSNTFSHYGSQKDSDITGVKLGHPSTFVERIKSNGYVGYRAVGENILAGKSTIEDAVSVWLDSPGHCANIMNASYKEMGIAKYKNRKSSYKIYWSNEFGAK